MSQNTEEMIGVLSQIPWWVAPLIVFGFGLTLVLVIKLYSKLYAPTMESYT